MESPFECPSGSSTLNPKPLRSRYIFPLKRTCLDYSLRGSQYKRFLKKGGGPRDARDVDVDDKGGCGGP